jgi:hypothetical protein
VGIHVSGVVSSLTYTLSAIPVGYVTRLRVTPQVGFYTNLSGTSSLIMPEQNAAGVGVKRDWGYLFLPTIFNVHVRILFLFPYIIVFLNHWQLLTSWEV